MAGYQTGDQGQEHQQQGRGHGGLDGDESQQPILGDCLQAGPEIIPQVPPEGSGALWLP